MKKLSLSIEPINGKGYKSIGRLQWADIPGFCILTGRNGSGKTQLLELIAYSLTGTVPIGASMPKVEIIGETYKASEVGYVPSGGLFSGSIPSSLRDMHQMRTQAVQSIQNIHNVRHNIQETIKLQKLIQRVGAQHINHNQIDEYAAKLSDDFEFAIDDIDIIRGLSHVFLAYRVKRMESLERGQGDVARDGSPLGPSPWSIVNEALQVAGFPYEVSSPEDTPIMSPYVLKMKDRHTGTEISDVNLSSGEKVIFQLVLWLFAADEKGLFPKILLLDEPDAHLHPSMTTQFLDVISDVFVKRHGVRVIISSHSPSTVALAPDGAIFQISRLNNMVSAVSSRAEIISALTAGLVTVSRSTKFCFVEDEEDVDFYTTIYDILSDSGPSRDPKSLAPSPSIVFIPVSVGSNASKLAGGSSIVSKWVGKLDAEPLDRTFFGFIDRDAANTGSPRLFVLGRYSFENYILDTPNVFALMLENGNAPGIDDLTISPGDEHLLRLQPSAILQKISDAIVELIEGANPDLAGQNRQQITYTNGAVINVPIWVLEKRGHDLLHMIQGVAGGARIVSPPRLLKSLRRARLIPLELAQLFANLQSA